MDETELLETIKELNLKDSNMIHLHQKMLSMTQVHDKSIS